MCIRVRLRLIAREIRYAETENVESKEFERKRTQINSKLRVHNVESTYPFPFLAIVLNGF